MKLRSHSPDARKVRANPDLTPLIDVVFQLLVFFMLSATFVVQSSIHIEMPRADGATSLEKKDITVTLAYDEGSPDGGGSIFMDGESMADLKDLSARLVTAARERDDVLLLIRSDSRASAGRLIEVVGLAKSLGIRHTAVAAKPLSNEPTSAAASGS
jgi:biopolymer transport protein ExbD